MFVFEIVIHKCRHYYTQNCDKISSNDVSLLLHQNDQQLILLSAPYLTPFFYIRGDKLNFLQ